MSIGGIAGLIAAIAFAVLVVFICLNLSKLSTIMKDAQETVKKLNTTLDVVTKDVDNLSIEVEGLLNKANTLVDDVNGKLGKTDPLFTAIGDLGVTVSDLNDSTKQMTSNLLSNVGSKNSSSLNKLRKRASTLSKVRNYAKTDKSDVDKSAPVRKQKSSKQNAAEDQLKAFIQSQPSKTAGEIKIK